MTLTRWIALGLACLFTAGCASTDWEAKYRDKESQATELTTDLDAAREDLARLQEGNRMLTEQLARERAEKDRMASDLHDAQARAAEASEPVVAAQPAVDLDALKKKMDFGDVKLDDSGNVVITLESGITFSPGSARLTTSGRAILARVAGTLNSEFAGRRIRLIGHTDSDPIKKSGFADNWALGFERARAVGVYFRDEGKIPAEQLDLVSRGANDPVASNANETGKKKNRRVEVVVVLPEGAAADYR